MNEVAANPFALATQTQSRQVSGAIAQTEQQRAVAEVQAKLLMAQQFPRDEVAATDRILNAFTRQRLAETAKYQYARGGSDIDGPSIRSAETIAQLWGNMEFGFREISRGKDYDGVTFSEVEAFAFDLQNRTRRPLQFRIRHWRDTKKGGYPITDERDIYELIANQAQRRVRSCILAVVPGDVVEAAMQQAELTLHAKADTSPEAMKKLLDAFGEFGVTKEQIEKRIQRRLEAIQPAQVVSLRKIYVSLKDAMSSPADWFEMPEQQATTQTGGEATSNARTEALKSHLKGGKKAEAEPKPQAPDPDDELLKEVETAERQTAGQSSMTMTYAEVAKRINAAKDMDELAAAGDLIQAVESQVQRDELSGTYKTKLNELKGK